jgi:hypothetical protein
VHWAKFSLAMHSWTEPIERLLKATQLENFTVTTLLIGEPVVIGETLPDRKWWRE